MKNWKDLDEWTKGLYLSLIKSIVKNDKYLPNENSLLFEEGEDYKDFFCIVYTDKEGYLVEAYYKTYKFKRKPYTFEKVDDSRVKFLTRLSGIGYDVMKILRNKNISFNWNNTIVSYVDKDNTTWEIDINGNNRCKKEGETSFDKWHFFI